MAFEIRDTGARLAGNHRPCCGIPGLELQLPKSVDAAGGEIAKIQGGRTAATDRLSFDKIIPELRQDRIQPLTKVIWKAGNQQCMRKFRHIGDMEPLTVAKRALSPSTAEHFVTHRVVNGTANDLAFLLDGYRDAVKRVTMSEIGRSI